MHPDVLDIGILCRQVGILKRVLQKPLLCPSLVTYLSLLLEISQFSDVLLNIFLLFFFYFYYLCIYHCLVFSSIEMENLCIFCCFSLFIKPLRNNFHFIRLTLLKWFLVYWVMQPQPLLLEYFYHSKKQNHGHEQ